jgi:hypothetical protein
VALALAATGCGTANHGPPAIAGVPKALLAGLRQIGPGPRFYPPATGPVLGSCRPALGPRSAAHLELFAENHVVLIGAGIGTRPPRRSDAGRIVAARCYGSLVTLDSTGVVDFRPGARLTVADVFRSWGQPLSATRLASFRASGAGRVTAYVGGRRWHGAPSAIALTEHAEIVLEVGPHVPPHTAYAFPPLPR